MIGGIIKMNLVLLIVSIVLGVVGIYYSYKFNNNNNGIVIQSAAVIISVLLVLSSTVLSFIGLIIIILFQCGLIVLEFQNRK